MVTDFILGYYRTVGLSTPIIRYAYGLAAVCEEGLRPKLREKRLAWFEATTYHIGEAVELLPGSTVYGIFDPLTRLNAEAQFVVYRAIDGRQEPRLQFTSLRSFLEPISPARVYFSYAGQTQPIKTALD